MIYEGYTVYKQWHKKEQRWYAYLYNPVTQDRTTLSWAKYIMSKHLDRYIDPDVEEVDHKNNDKTDDTLDNLQLLTKQENMKKTIRGRTMVTLICPACKKSFTRERKNTHLIKGGRHTCCSRTCGRKP